MLSKENSKGEWDIQVISSKQASDIRVLKEK